MFALNKHLRVRKFKMLTYLRLLWSVRPKKFPRFHYEAVAYEFLSLSPRVFSKVVEAALTPINGQRVKVLAYLDDWLIEAESREQEVVHTSRLVSHVGFIVTQKKSCLILLQHIPFLDLDLDS